MVISLPEASGVRYPADNFSEAKALKQWICWRYKDGKRGKKSGKVPTHPTEGYDISHLDPSNWMSFEEATKHLETSSFLYGIGFVPTEDDGLCFLDIDERIDEETGEIPTLVIKLLDVLNSFAYRTPNYGVRIVVKATLANAGGDYVWTDPDTAEEHVFEVYDKSHFLTFTDPVIHDVPIKEHQEFIDSLVKKSGSGVRRNVQNLSEVELPKDLDEARKKIKLLFEKHDLDPGPILMGARKITLNSYFRKIVRNEAIEIAEEFDPEANPGADPGAEADELWQLINWANETMLYDRAGEYQEPLDKDELEEVYLAVTKRLPGMSPEEVQEKLDGLRQFLIEIKVRINYRQDSMWKVLKALEEHGRKKYGSLLSEHQVKVDIGWLALMKRARIGSKSTLQRALSELERRRIITRGWDDEDRTGHFVVDLKEAMSLSSWGIGDGEVGFYAQQYNSDGGVFHTCTGVHKELEVTEAEGEDSSEGLPRETLLTDLPTLEALVHTTWYRQVGPAKIKYVLAVYYLGGGIGGKATNKEVAEFVGIKPTSASRPLKELVKAGLLYQEKDRAPYEVNATVADDLYRFRFYRGEFARDELAKRKDRDERRFHAYQKKLTKTILDLLEDGMGSEEAFSEAVERVSPPKGIDDYGLAKRQEWASKAAQREWRVKQKAKRDPARRRRRETTSSSEG